MNVADAKRVAQTHVDPQRVRLALNEDQGALVALADEVHRLEAQLERTRTELAEATVRLAEWDRMNTVLAAVLPALEQQMTPTPSREAGL